MTSAGISLPRSLEILSRQTKSKKFSDIILSVKDDVVKGNSFSDSLAKHPEAFSQLFTSMIRVGETGGKLEDVLDILTKQMSKEHELKQKIIGALIYPSVIVFTMIIIGIAMLVFVVPKISETFIELKIPLPKSTQFVIWLGNTLAHRGHVIFIPLAILIFLLFKFLKTEPGKKMSSFLFLKIPIVAGIVKKSNTVRMSRTLSSLISAGVPLAESLSIISDSSGNYFYKQAMARASEQVIKGKKLSEVLNNYLKIYPLLVVQMIEVGEETGQSSQILEKLAEFYEEEVANSTKNLSSVIEPMVMLIVGGAIGFFAISMIQPMYSMLGAIK
jgi:type IV pilus assembly protein PilC